MTEPALSLRVALAGLGGHGWHLIERCSTGEPFRIVAAHDSQSPNTSRDAEALTDFGIRVTRSLEELTHTPEFEVSWITRPEWLTPDFASRLFERGRDLVVESPTEISLSLWDELSSLAKRFERRLLLHHFRQADISFRQALAVAESNSIGTLQAAKFISWNYAQPPRGISLGQAEPISAWPAVARAVDELLRIHPHRPITVSAICDKVDSSAPRSLLLIITFETGARADIDIRLDSPTPTQTGWILTGHRGGYADGRQFTLTDDGEVFESPVGPLNTSDDSLQTVAQQLRHGDRDHNSAEERFTRSLLAILDAARRSITQQQSAAIDS